jgi:lysozyme
LGSLPAVTVARRVVLGCLAVALAGCGGPATTTEGGGTTTTGDAPALKKGARGVNVSSAQGDIDWKKVAGSDIKFAVIRASYGPDQDRSFKKNLKGARANGLRVGAYHRIAPRTQLAVARRHAQVFVDQIRKYGEPGDLVPVLDIEPPFGGLSQRELAEWIQIWTSALEKGLGVKAMVYTSADEWRRYVGDTAALARNGHPLWVADVENDPPELPANDWAGNGWAIWQRIQREDIPGIKGLVDVNVFGLNDEKPVVLNPK